MYGILLSLLLYLKQIFQKRFLVIIPRGIPPYEKDKVLVVPLSFKKIDFGTS